MINFIHGENQTSSRNELKILIDAAKVNNKEIIKLDGLKINLNQALQALESGSLFGQEKTIIIENLFSRMKSKEKDEIVKYLKNEIISTDIIFWEKKEVSGTTTRWLPKNWQYKFFKTPAIIFNFLDSIKPNNPKQSLMLLKKLINDNSAEMVFYMLIKRIRELIIAADLGREGLTGAPWQIGKLLSQAKAFNLNKLTDIYGRLLKIDTDIKTGRTFMQIDWHLDLLIADI